MDFNARFYSSRLGRFISADTIIPEQTQGVQAWDRYAGMNNNPIRYKDSSGHTAEENNPPPPPITYDEEHGLCINIWNIGCSGGTSYEDWYTDEYLPRLPEFTGDDFASVSTVLQDIALGFSLAGASLEVAGAVAGGPAGAEIGYAMQLIITNPVESAFSWASTGLTVFADILHGDTYVNVSVEPLSIDGSVGESTVTSVVGSYVGTLIPEGIVDSLIDGYLSSYNHGEAPGVFSLINTIFDNH